jgi:hypothetical protein
VNWFSAIWISIAALGFLVLTITRRVRVPRDGYENCGSFAGSDDEEDGSQREGTERRRHGSVKNAQLKLVKKKEPGHQVKSFRAG